MINHDPEEIRKKIDQYREMGIKDSHFLKGSNILACNPESIRKNIIALSGLGISMKEINRAKSLLEYNPSFIAEKLRYADRLLALGNVPIKALDIFKQAPGPTSTMNMKRMSVVARLLAEHGSQDTLADDIAGSLTIPVDSMMAVAAGDEPATSARLAKEAEAVTGDDRRTKTLGLISANLADGNYSERLVRSYFMYQPLKPEELAIFPYLERYEKVGQKK